MIVALSMDDEAAVSTRESGAAGSGTMAVFGAHEGLPGLCDPGWRVLAAVPRTPTPIWVL